MKSWLHEKAQNAAPDDTAMVLRTDMDGLKAINDTFGHAEGETMGSEPSRMLFRALPVMMRYVYAQAVMSFVL